jgi:hypothetical protein
MHAIIVFDLCLLIVFEVIVVIGLIVALYLIRKFSQHASDSYIFVTILMITLYYTTVCMNFYIFARASSQRKSCLELLKSVIGLTTTFNAIECI